MLTIEGAKCRICGTQHAADAATCPVCGAKTHAPAPAAKPAAGKARPEPFGLDSATLLAKINSLDWEEPTIQPGAAPAAALPPPPAKRALLLPFLVGFAVLLIGMLALRYFSGNRPASAPPPVSQAAVAPPAPTTPVPAEPPAATPSITPLPAATEPQPSLSADDLEQSKKEEARLRRAELKRKALAAKQALEEQGRLERAEQEQRLRAEREAAEARARAAAAAAATPAAPKGPTSPQEVCAGEQNVFSQGACEARTCAMAQWRNHPFCVKRWQDELRKLSPSGAEN